MIWVCVMFAALNIDRGNISNATSDNMLDDLKLSDADYVSGCAKRLWCDSANAAS